MGNDVSMFSGNEKESSKKLENWKKDWKLNSKSVKEVLDMANGLKMNGGRITKENFVNFLTGRGTVDKALAERYFNAVDKDHSGTVDEDEMLEFYGTVYTDSNGSTIFGKGKQLKLKLSFKIARGDKDVIDAENLFQTILAKMNTNYRLNKKLDNLPTEPVPDFTEEARKKATEILAKADKDGDGALSLDELINANETNPYLVQDVVSFD
eukprot:TRINITY_DN6738_c0_g1_i1.p1 TRINITY_DN6738_c0_g1~~TRINITY_DN6738_c0_g1_i1.p1  ORF type:complete len:210 (-),score=74.93 TRINITY_DN6738_c0_g1_i1:34-663(-)